MSHPETSHRLPSAATRAAILLRIRTALQYTTAKPQEPADPAVFPAIPPNDLLQRFATELAALKGELLQASTWAEAQAHLGRMAEESQFVRIVATPHPDIRQACGSVVARTLTGDHDCGPNLAQADLGITPCDCLVARTGSIVLTSRSGFGRSLSVLPPAHLVVARRSQLVADLSDAFRLLRSWHGAMWPSMMTIISGPSRTADIEKILVLGAHGPRKLMVLLLNF